MLEKLADHSMWDREGMKLAVDEMIAAANSIPEGAPVGTVKQRPDGTFVAVRCGDVSPYPASWVYVRVMPGACEEPYGDEADSWPSYGEITPEPEGCGIGLDGECEGKCRKGDAPVGTIARRPDGAWVALRDRFGWQYFHLGYPGDGIDADSWPVIYDPTKPGGLIEAQRWAEWFAAERDDARKLYQHFERKAALATELAFDRALSIDLGDEWGEWGCNTLVEVLSALGVKPGMNLGDIYEMVERGLEWFPPGEEPIAPRPDPTAQQEPGESLARGLDDIAAGRVSRRDDYLEPQQEPEDPGPPTNAHIEFSKPARTPRVVDRLGVDEQGSRWHGAEGAAAYFHDGQSWRTNQGRVFPAGYQPDWNAPYTEILGDPS
ncbi:Uncharacterised protein [Mycobacteroides abscessus subsp. bolletii]|nr:Uncharacterised protein [Mycobacteroides abscessus subsp. bolletii]SLD37470.1 Uncharacterised protein [Mycobacteroides abscessus subsp. bolletii]